MREHILCADEYRHHPEADRIAEVLAGAEQLTGHRPFARHDFHQVPSGTVPVKQRCGRNHFGIRHIRAALMADQTKRRVCKFGKRREYESHLGVNTGSEYGA